MQRICAACGRNNRIPYRHTANAGRCGACKAALPPPDAPIAITDADEFGQLIAAVPVPLLIDVWREVVRPLPAGGASSQ